MPREKNPVNVTVRKRAPRKSGAPGVTAMSFTRFVDPEQRAALIAEAAFFRAEKRGFVPGHEIEDWLDAESEVDARLMRATEAGPRV
jgi:hypothetical protein